MESTTRVPRDHEFVFDPACGFCRSAFFRRTAPGLAAVHHARHPLSYSVFALHRGFYRRTVDRVPALAFGLGMLARDRALALGMFAISSYVVGKNPPFLIWRPLPQSGTRLAPTAPPPKKIYSTLTVLLGVVLAAIIALPVRLTENFPAFAQPQNPPWKISAPCGLFVDRSNQGVLFGSADLKGKLWVADFIFTRCRGRARSVRTHGRAAEESAGNSGSASCLFR